MKFIIRGLISLVLISLVAFHLTAQEDNAFILVGSNGLSFELTSFQFREAVGRYQPNNGVIFAIMGQLRNTSDQRACVYARDIRLILEDRLFAPQRVLMRELQASLPDHRDYVGPLQGQCVDAQQTEPTFIAFDAPRDFTRFRLRFLGAEEGYAIDLTASAAPTTPADATLTTEASLLISTPGASDAALAISPTAYVVTADANVRACPSTQCGVVQSLRAGETVTVVGIVGAGEPVSGNAGWYQLEGGDRYVHSTLVTIAPAAESASATPTAASTPPVGDVTCPGLDYTCTQLTCAQAYACLAAGNSRLDVDGDGTPCEAVCGG